MVHATQDNGGGQPLKGRRGTPDKEAEQKSRVSPSQVAPLVLVPPAAEAVNKVEMSGATVAALRRMMLEEAKLGG